ncbi:tetratricopeptide repeat protein [Tahibacter caeni]|uniref:tetratricopeptide repeat protein n=1 Tax=Tahibacter caeni TaxID=1453545 RepID=UPI0021472551|nr:tetratricopeptide repeat protein [Tahibacter caeni]
MATSELFRRFGRACLLAVLAAATPVLAGDDIAADWRRLLDEGEEDAVYDTYALIAKVRNDDGEIDAVACREQADAIAAALTVNPVGLGVWYMAQECARLTGDEAIAQQRLSRFEALLRHTLADYRLGDAHPMRVLSEHDVDAVVAASGQSQLYSYYEPYDNERELTYTIGLWDEKTQRETVFGFDFLDAGVALRRRRLPAAEFPHFRRQLVEALVASAAEHSPGSPLAQLVVVDASRGPELIRDLERQAQAGNFMAAVIQAAACTEYTKLACADAAIDALLPYAEKRYGMALVALAFVYARRSDAPVDLKAARALIEQADLRLGEARGSISFAGLTIQIGDRAARAELVEKELRKAARDGNVIAGLMLAVARTLRENAQPEGRYLDYVQAAADADYPSAQYWLAQLLLEKKQSGEAAALMRKAAAGGFAQAQLWFGRAQYFGEDGVARDEKQGLEWLRQAGYGGQGDASALVGAYYLDQSDDVANLQRAREWLRGAVLAHSRQGALQLARLYARNIESVGSTAQAAALFQAIVADYDDAVARRELAQLLIDGEGIDKDEKRAEALLRVDAQKGVAGNQLALARLLQSQAGAAQKAEGLEWLRKAAGSGDPESQNALASALWYGRGVDADRAAARRLWQQASTTGKWQPAANDLAWALCTPRDAALLDAEAGLAAVTPLVDGDGVPFGFVDTLASCQAAAGDFAAAVATQQRALALAEQRANLPASVTEGMRARLASYRRGERAASDH